MEADHDVAKEPVNDFFVCASFYYNMSGDPSVTFTPRRQVDKSVPALSNDGVSVFSCFATCDTIQELRGQVSMILESARERLLRFENPSGIVRIDEEQAEADHTEAMDLKKIGAVEFTFRYYIANVENSTGSQLVSDKVIRTVFERDTEAVFGNTEAWLDELTQFTNVAAA